MTRERFGDITWTTGIGWVVALAIGILAVLLFALGRLELPWTMGICAVCALRL